MRRVTLQLGDVAWFHGPVMPCTRTHLEIPFFRKRTPRSRGGNWQHGKVVHIFKLYNEDQYVIEVDTGIDPVYEVRDGFTVSDSQDRAIGFWRRGA